MLLLSSVLLFFLSSCGIQDKEQGLPAPRLSSPPQVNYPSENSPNTSSSGGETSPQDSGTSGSTEQGGTTSDDSSSTSLNLSPYSQRYFFEETGVVTPSGWENETRLLSLTSSEIAVFRHVPSALRHYPLQEAFLKIWVFEEHTYSGTGLKVRAVVGSPDENLQNYTYSDVNSIEGDEITLLWTDGEVLDTATIEIGPVNARTTHSIRLYSWDISSIFGHDTRFLIVRTHNFTSSQMINLLGRKSSSNPPYLDLVHNRNINQTYWLNYRKSSPRIYLNAQQVEHYPDQVSVFTNLNLLLDRIQSMQTSYLSEPVETFWTAVPNTHRSHRLWRARGLQDRIFFLGTKYLVDPSPDLLNRIMALLEYPNLESIITTKTDGNYYLNISELSLAYAVAYDWLKPYLSNSQASFIRERLQTLWDEFASQVYNPYLQFWISDRSNWNIVCFSAFGLLSLVLTDPDNPNTQGQAAYEAGFYRAFSALRWNGFRSFSTDGAWYEGPGYFGFVLRLLSAFLTASWNTFQDLPAYYLTPGLFATTTFAHYIVSPTWKPFNYADSNSNEYPNFIPYALILDQLFFRVSDDYSQPQLFSFYESAVVDQITNPFLPFIWMESDDATSPQLIQTFPNSGIGVIRQNWGDPMGSYLAVKGGTNGQSHGDLDAGSFIFDSLGVRWIHDLGMDNYSLENYFVYDPNQTPNRWKYTRKRASNHNTLVFKPVNLLDQLLNTVAPINGVAVDNNQFRYLKMNLKSVATNQTISKHDRWWIMKEASLRIRDELTSSGLSDGVELNLIVEEKTWTQQSQTLEKGIEYTPGNSHFILYSDLMVSGSKERRYLKVEIVEPTGLSWNITNPQPHSAVTGTNTEDSVENFKRMNLNIPSIPSGNYNLTIDFKPYITTPPTVSWPARSNYPNFD